MNAVVLLGLLTARHYGWSWVEPELRGITSKALGAGLSLFLLWMLYRESPTKPLLLVVLYGTFEELQTLICSVSYAFSPWVVPTGQSICSARLDFDLGAIGVMLLAAILHKVCQYERLAGFGKAKDM